MSLFDSIKGPKWQHGNPEVRREAIEQLDDQQQLLELATSDPDPAVQAAALSRITDPDILDGLIETLPHDLQQQARRQRLRQFLPSADRLAAIDDDEVLQRIISLGDDAGLIDGALARINSDQVRLQIASSHPVARVRLSAARGIESIDLLGELMQSAKGHDKAVFRHCKTLVDEHQAREMAAAERRVKILRLCEKAAELARTPHAPDYEASYRVLVGQWRALRDSASPAQQEQFGRDQAICAQHMVELADAHAAAEQARADIAAVRQEFPAVLAELQRINDAATLPEEHAAITRLSERLDDIENRWQSATKITPPSAEETQTYQEHLEMWRSILRTLQRLDVQSSQLEKIFSDAGSVDPMDHHALQQQVKRAAKMASTLMWAEEHRARMPEQMIRLQQALEQLQSQFRKLDSDQPKHAARLQACFETLCSELDQDHVVEAGKALARARRLLKSLAPKQRQQFERKLQPLAARWKEADDWRNFAIEPKKEELCDRMTALIGSEDDAEVLAAKIKLLQDEWKQLGALPHARDQVLWNKFKTAADEAWKPCKAAFAQQAALRRENFARRMQLVAQLTEYEEKMDWPAQEGGQAQVDGSLPDWRLVQKTLDTAREAFRGFKPVDQKSDRISHKAFRAVCDRIYAHIKQEYARNISQKEHLLERARNLEQAEDLPQAIEQCKALQREWKTVGITPVAMDRKLWKAFRAACDSVFNRLDAQRAQQSAEQDARVKEAESLRDQARALLNSKHDDQLNRTLSGLKQKFLEIGLPAGVQSRLSRDFQAIEKEARGLAQELRRKEEQACWTSLLDKISACALKSSDEAAAGAMWETAGEVPRGIDAEALEQFWQQGPAAGAEGQWRDACIALEILGEIESPPEDKKARMNYQMQRLVTAMGRGSGQPEPSLEEHINGLIGLRPSRQWAERYCSALRQIKA